MPQLTPKEMIAFRKRTKELFPNSDPNDNSRAFSVASWWPSRAKILDEKMKAVDEDDVRRKKRLFQGGLFKKMRGSKDEKR